MYDYIIVGGGVAGLYTASLLKNKNVLMIEEHKNLGPLRCSGLVSSRINDFFDLPANIVERKVRKANLWCAGKSYPLDINSLVLDKEKFEKFLIKRAEKYVEVIYGRAKSIKEKDKSVVITTEKGTLEAKYIIGCDGANSLVRKTFIGEKIRKMYFGQFVYSAEKPGDSYEVFFDSKYSDLFSWIVPRRGKVEYGLIAEKNLKCYVQNFFSEKSPKKVTLRGYGTIPVGLCRCSFRRGILMGNAAGQTKPLTGGGIIYSLMAAQVAARELNKEIPDLAAYERACQKMFGREVMLQMWVRKAYSRMSDWQKAKALGLLIGKGRRLDMDFPMSNIFGKNVTFF